MKILFIQKRANKAGAQVCLAKTLEALKSFNIHARVIMGEEGWLTHRLRDLEALGGVADFPSFRAPLSRWLKIGRFSRRVSEVWGKYGPFNIIHANDTWDALLTEWLASRNKVPWLVHLRYAEMHQSHYYKHHCHKAHAAIAVSPVIFDIVQKWPHQILEYIPEGLSEGDFWPVMERECRFPEEIGVIGHGGEVKGWDIFARAMQRVADTRGTLPTRVVFLGDINPKSQKDLVAQLPAVIETIFAGRIDRLAAEVRTLDLIVAPSRQESFGMAMVETIAAGVPLLASCTGIVPYLLGEDSPWAFSPGDPESLAQAWLRLPALWSGRHEAIRDWQSELRRKFMVNQTTQQLAQVYAKILS